MARSRERERFFQKQGKAERAAALGQAYGMGDIKVARLVGQYPPRDYLKEQLMDYEHTEETCPGHVASLGNGKVCARCGTHIDSLRPPEDEL